MTGRGILCAFAGQTEMIWNTYRGSKSLQSSHSSIQPTHIVHIRFTDSQVRSLCNDAFKKSNKSSLQHISFLRQAMKTGSG